MMRWFYKLPLRFRSLFRKSTVERELTDELRFHLEKLIEENVARGMAKEEARYAALRELGGAEQVKEECRDMRQVNYVENFIQDLRYGLRQLRRSPGFTAVAVFTLAFGIAVTAALFSILECAYIHFPGPKNGSRVVVLTQRFTKRQSETWLFSPAEYFDIAGLRRSFDGFFAVAHANPTLTETAAQVGTPERVPAVRATANMFSLYGVSPARGRVFTAEEDRPGGPNVAVVTFRLWNRRFGQAPSI